MDGLNREREMEKKKKKRNAHDTKTLGSPQTRQLLVYTTTTGPWPVWQMFGGFSCSFLLSSGPILEPLLFGWIAHANLTMFSRAGPTRQIRVPSVHIMYPPVAPIISSALANRNNKRRRSRVCRFVFLEAAFCVFNRKPCVYRLTARWRPPVYGSIRPIFFFLGPVPRGIVWRQLASSPICLFFSSRFDSFVS